MNQIRTGTVLVALSVGLSACGGGSSGSSSGGLSRAQLIAKANAICASAKSSAAAIPTPASFRDATVAAAYFDKLTPITDKETYAIAALVPAASVKSDWEAFVTAQQAADTLLQTIKHKADTKDRSGLADLAKAGPAGQAVAAAASKLGATGCAK